MLLTQYLLLLLWSLFYAVLPVVSPSCLAGGRRVSRPTRYGALDYCCATGSLHVGGRTATLLVLLHEIEGLVDVMTGTRSSSW